MNENLLPAFLTVREASQILDVAPEVLYRLAAEGKVRLGADPFLLLLNEGQDPNKLKELFSSPWLKSEEDIKREEREKFIWSRSVFELAEIPNEPEPDQARADILYISKEELIRLTKSDLGFEIENTLDTLPVLEKNSIKSKQRKGKKSSHEHVLHSEIDAALLVLGDNATRGNVYSWLCKRAGGKNTCIIRVDEKNHLYYVHKNGIEDSTNINNFGEQLRRYKEKIVKEKQ